MKMRRDAPLKDGSRLWGAARTPAGSWIAGEVVWEDGFCWVWAIWPEWSPELAPERWALAPETPAK